MRRYNACDRPRWARRRRGLVALDPTMIYSAFRVIGDLPATRANASSRGAIGTGFLVRVHSERLPGVGYGYALTAHHVIRDQNDVEIQPAYPDGGMLYDPLPIDDWRQPLDKVDLAIAPAVRRGEELYAAAQLETDFIPPGVAWLQLGSKIHYVGILAPLDRPMVRSGYIGALDQIDLPGGDDDYDYPVHLVDCRSYGGFSGSPCLFDAEFAGLVEADISDLDPPDDFPPVGAMYHVAMLCGMFTEHLDDRARTGAVSRYGVGIMLRSDEIWEALMNDEAKAERSQWDDIVEAAEQQGPKRQPVSVGDSEQEFERFEALMGQLVKVPKIELDERRRNGEAAS
jgi:hypothetical protein